MRACFALAALLALLLAPALAAAQDGEDDEEISESPRRARLLYLSGDAPAVLLEDDVAWAPTIADGPVTVCAGNRCAGPVARTECAMPECPGPGTKLTLLREIGDVRSFPTDVSGFREEIEAMRTDSVLAQLSGYFGEHPDHDPYDDSDDRKGIFFHASAAGALASWADGGGVLAGGMFGIGLLFAVDGDEIWGDDELGNAVLESLLGDRMRLSVRGSILTPIDSQTLAVHGSVGLSIETSNRLEDSALELPTLLSLAVPEMGAAWDDGSAPGFYARWSIPVRIFFGEAGGLEVRSAVSVVDVPGDGTEAIATVSLGGFLR